MNHKLTEYTLLLNDFTSIISLSEVKRREYQNGVDIIRRLSKTCVLYFCYSVTC